MQLKGGAGYMKDEPYEKILRDIRIFPIFEGANDVMRAFIALSGMKPVGEKLSGLGDIGLGDPIGSIGVLADYVGGRIKREVRPDRITQGPPRARGARRRGRRPGQGAALGHRVAAARAQKEIVERQFQQKRLAAAISDIYAQIAVLSRVTLDLRGPGRRALGPGALHRRHLLHPRRRPRALELPPDRAQRRRADSAIAKLAYKRGEYGYALFED